MSYVPPHKRVSGSRPIPSPPPSQNRRIRRGQNDFQPEVRIHWSGNSIRSFNIVPLDSLAYDEQVEFVRFVGDSFAHLQDIPLYTLQSASSAKDRKEPSSENTELMTGINLEENRNSGISIFEILRPGLTNVIELWKACPQFDGGDKIILKLRLRFGRLLFQAAPRGCFDWHGRYIPRDVENLLQQGEVIKKTFDNSLSREEFMLFQERADRNVISRRSKEQFLIEVEDELRPNFHLWCICSRLKHSEGSSENHQLSEAKSDAQHFLEIRKVKLSPVRCLVADAACISKSKDFRLAFFTEKNLLTLTEEEKCDLDSLLSSVHIDENVKGGLHWPLGSTCSASGRFKIVGSWHKKQTNVIGAGLKWYLQEVNRVEFKFSSGRSSYEVAVKPLNFRECFKGPGEWSTDDMLQSIKELLAWIWTDCL